MSGNYETSGNCGKKVVAFDNDNGSDAFRYMSVLEDPSDPINNDLTITYTEANFNIAYLADYGLGIT